MIYQRLLTQLLEFPTDFHALVSKNLYWNTKSTKHYVQKCIGRSFTAMIQQWHQFQPFGEMFDHNQNI